jgi:carboxymethylenebutenolidase
MWNQDSQNDFDSLLPGTSTGAGASRRTALKTALGVGFAVSVLPIEAQTVITTPTDGLTVGEVTIDVQGFKMPAYRAAPAGKTNLPVVLVISEIFGVHQHIADVAVRFARQGYLAIAPEMFVRQGDAKNTEYAKLLSDIIAKVPDAQVMGDLDATVAWAATQGGDLNRLGITGFCWGGRITWLYTAHQPKIKAGVAWYGRLVGAQNELTPVNPVDIVGKLNAPVLGLYGGADAGIPQDSVEKMRAALKQGPATAQASEIVVYPEMPHAFHADYRPSYRKPAAEDGWKRCLAWFKTQGVI